MEAQKLAGCAGGWGEKSVNLSGVEIGVVVGGEKNQRSGRTEWEKLSYYAEKLPACTLAGHELMLDKHGWKRASRCCCFAV